MLGEVVEDNLFIQRKVVRIYAKNPLWEPIPIQRKLSITFFIQKERVFMLGDSNPKKLVFEMPKVGNKKVKIFF